RALIARWAEARLAEGGPLVAVDRDDDRFYLRLAGDEKDFVTVWLTLRQRTLHHEAQMMPAPETNVTETYEYLLRRNAELRQMRFALGAEDAVYLVGELPLVDVTEDELDRIVGSSLEYVDAYFPTAMQIGYAGKYRRRRRRPPA
ncbi:MAG TPA: YbjN domain-containing protein, partial [Acidimicrobiales bacterium]|nr:YbjN domain-containing protein [Acidimicrobiales bacterium]